MNAETLKTWGIIISILGVGVSIGMFKGTVSQVQAKQDELEIKVDKFGDAYNRLTKIETILDERLPAKKTR